jgi:hypothetical protein
MVAAEGPRAVLNLQDFGTSRWQPPIEDYTTSRTGEIAGDFRQWTLFGPHAMSDLSPECVSKAEIRMTDKQASTMRTSELPHYTPPG